MYFAKLAEEYIDSRGLLGHPASEHLRQFASWLMIQYTNPIPVTSLLEWEIAKAEELKNEYKKFGGSGKFGVSIISSAIVNAKAAIMSGELNSMNEALKALRGLE